MTDRKPKILLSALSRPHLYVDAVNACGGIAEVEHCAKFSDSFDGLILCGGNDIDPKYYGEEINGAKDFDPSRDSAEYELTKAFIAAGKPILGICRGLQMINVVLGGSLIQHIDCAEKHIPKNGVDSAHYVKTVEGSIFEKLYGKEFTVASAHHEAIKKLGDGLKVTLTAGDIIEGIEHESLPIFAVQFHPERMCLTQKRNDTDNGIKIFEHFIGMCTK